MVRRPLRVDPTQPDAIDQAIEKDRESVADQLAMALEDLGPVDHGSIKGILYKIPVPNGKYEWIRDVFPPFDMSALMAELKNEIGGGDYALRLMAEGRVRKTIHFSIFRDPKPLINGSNNGDTMSLVQLMMAQQAEASRESRASSDRQMQMMMQMSQQSTQMMVSMMTALVGSQGKPTDFLPIIAAMKDGNTSGGLKEMVETMSAVKLLIAPPSENGGFDPDDLVGSAIKLAGPVVGAIGRAVGQGRQPQPQNEPQPDQPLSLPPPQPQAMQETPLPQNGAGGMAGDPVANLIKPDILYFFNRGHDPEKAADAIYDVIEAGLNQGVITEENINDLVSAYTLSPDWLGDLAQYGIDLRSNPAWASQFLTSLVAIHLDAMQNGDNSGGQNGGGANNGDHVETSPPRVESNEGQEISG